MKVSIAKIVVIASTFASIATAAHSQSAWPVGVEREVDEGYYMKIAAERFGWRIWRVETENETSCKAMKSARGRPHPIPVGVGSEMFRGTPFLEMRPSISEGRVRQWRYDWNTIHGGRVAAKVRLLGERFWTEWGPADINLDSFSERLIEIVVSSWEYPAALVGYAEEQAVFDLAGLGWAKEQVNSCLGITAP